MLKWGAERFNVGSPDERVEGNRLYTQSLQFVFMQRYLPAPPAVSALRYYRVKLLSDDFEVNTVSVLCRARPLAWFHGTHADDMKKKKGAIICQF